MDAKTKHLEFIQAVINRLSTNSFLLKGWSVILVSALFVVSAQSSNLAVVFLAYLPACIFWGLDGYYLWQERLFRKLYDLVREQNSTPVDFSMDTSAVEKTEKGWSDAVVSKTLFLFHGALIGAILVVMLIMLSQ